MHPKFQKRVNELYLERTQSHVRNTNAYRLARDIANEFHELDESVRKELRLTTTTEDYNFEIALFRVSYGTLNVDQPIFTFTCSLDEVDLTSEAESHHTGVINREVINMLVMTNMVNRELASWIGTTLTSLDVLARRGTDRAHTMLSVNNMVLFNILNTDHVRHKSMEMDAITGPNQLVLEYDYSLGDEAVAYLESQFSDSDATRFVMPIHRTSYLAIGEQKVALPPLCRHLDVDAPLCSLDDVYTAMTRSTVLSLVTAGIESLDIYVVDAKTRLYVELHNIENGE